MLTKDQRITLHKLLLSIEADMEEYSSSCDTCYELLTTVGCITDEKQRRHMEFMYGANLSTYNSLVNDANNLRTILGLEVHNEYRRAEEYDSCIGS